MEKQSYDVDFDKNGKIDKKDLEKMDILGKSRSERKEFLLSFSKKFLETKDVKNLEIFKNFLKKEILKTKSEGNIDNELVKVYYSVLLTDGVEFDYKASIENVDDENFLKILPSNQDKNHFLTLLIKKYYKKSFDEIVKRKDRKGENYQIYEIIKDEVEKSKDERLKKFFDESVKEMTEILVEQYLNEKIFSGYEDLEKSRKSLFNELWDFYGRSQIIKVLLITFTYNKKLEEKYDHSEEQIREILNLLGKDKKEIEENYEKLLKFFGNNESNLIKIIDKKENNKYIFQIILEALDSDQKLTFSSLETFVTHYREFDGEKRFTNFQKFLSENKEKLKLFDKINPDLPRDYVYELLKRKFPIENFSIEEGKKIFSSKEKIEAITIFYNLGKSLDKADLIEKIKYYFSIIPDSFLKNFSGKILFTIDEKVWENKNKKWKYDLPFPDGKREKGEKTFEEILKIEKMSIKTIINILYSIDNNPDENGTEFTVKNYREKIGELFDDSVKDEDIKKWLTILKIPIKNIEIFKGIKNKKWSAKDLAYLGTEKNWGKVKLENRKEIVEKLLEINSDFSWENILYFRDSLEEIYVFKGLKKWSVKDLDFLGTDKNWGGLKLENRREIVEKFLKINPNFTGEDIMRFQGNGFGIGEKYGYKNKYSIKDEEMIEIIKFLLSLDNSGIGEDMVDLLIYSTKVGDTDEYSKFDENVKGKIKSYKEKYPNFSIDTYGLFYLIENEGLEVNKFVSDFEFIKNSLTPVELGKRNKESEILTKDILKKIKNNKLDDKKIILYLARGYSKEQILDSYLNYLEEGKNIKTIIDLLDKEIFSDNVLISESKNGRFLNKHGKKEERIDEYFLSLGKKYGFEEKYLKILARDYFTGIIIREKGDTNFGNNLIEFGNFSEKTGRLEKIIDYLDLNRNQVLTIGKEKVKVKIHGNRQFLLGILIYIYDKYKEVKAQNLDIKKIIEEYNDYLNLYLESSKKVDKIIYLGMNKYFGEDEGPLSNQYLRDLQTIFGEENIEDLTSGSKLGDENIKSPDDFLNYVSKTLEEFRKKNPNKKVAVFILQHGAIDGSSQFSKGYLRKEHYERLQEIISSNGFSTNIFSCNSGSKMDITKPKSNTVVNSGNNLSFGAYSLNEIAKNKKVANFNGDKEISMEDINIYQMINYEASPIIDQGFRMFYQSKNLQSVDKSRKDKKYKFIRNNSSTTGENRNENNNSFTRN